MPRQVLNFLQAWRQSIFLFLALLNFPPFIELLLTAPPLTQLTFHHFNWYY